MNKIFSLNRFLSIEPVSGSFTELRTAKFFSYSLVEDISYNIYGIVTRIMSLCALNATPNGEGSCFKPEQVSLVTKYTDGNMLPEIKRETKCPDDKCVLEKLNLPEEVKSKIEREAFKAPTASFDHNHWLNNTETDTIMSQMRHPFPGFAHGCILMIDLKTFNPTHIHSFDYPDHPVGEIDFAMEILSGLNKQTG